MTRFGYVMTTYFSVLAIGGLAFVHVSPKLIWNASASAPIGLYAVASDDDLAVGDLVVVDPPKSLAIYLDERGYLPEGVPLLKHIAALPGQRICRDGAAVAVDDTTVAQAQPSDRFGRAVPILTDEDGDDRYVWRADRDADALPNSSDRK